MGSQAGEEERRGDWRGGEGSSSGVRRRDPDTTGPGVCASHGHDSLASFACQEHERPHHPRTQSPPCPPLGRQLARTPTSIVYCTFDAPPTTSSSARACASSEFRGRDKQGSSPSSAVFLCYGLTTSCFFGGLLRIPLSLFSCPPFSPSPDRLPLIHLLSFLSSFFFFSSSINPRNDRLRPIDARVPVSRPDPAGCA